MGGTRNHLGSSDPAAELADELCISVTGFM